MTDQITTTAATTRTVAERMAALDHVEKLRLAAAKAREAIGYAAINDRDTLIALGDQLPERQLAWLLRLVDEATHAKGEYERAYEQWAETLS